MNILDPIYYRTLFYDFPPMYSPSTTMPGLSIKILGMNRPASEWVPKKRKGSRVYPGEEKKLASVKVEASTTDEIRSREFASV
jgi:hypothetical protein